MPMGPFSLSDLVGADIGVHVGANIVDSYPDRVYKSALFPMMVAQKRLGQKTGAGFYKYDEKRRATPDPDGIAPFLLKARQEARLQLRGGRVPEMSAQDIIEFIFFPVVNEGCRIIAEGFVDKPSDLDISVVFGMGFPAYRGGPIKWADLQGPRYVCQRLESFAQLLPQHAGFFKPCDYLKQCAANGTPLSAGISAAPNSRL
jgi:enoyl-CoA hydratase/3-hydroxyacyl-CoA dehydrogenase